MKKTLFPHNKITKAVIKGTAIGRYMGDKEKELGYRCRRVWSHEGYIYGKFDDGTKEGLIITLAYSETRLAGTFVPYYFAGGTL